MKKKGKLASVIAGAIAAYIKLEEEERAEALVRSRGGIPSLWGISARQNAMQLRNLYQLRFPKK